jgi:hypothetical protein
MCLIQTGAFLCCLFAVITLAVFVVGGFKTLLLQIAAVALFQVLCAFDRQQQT